jgi:hypothetical protein
MALSNQQDYEAILSVRGLKDMSLSESAALIKSLDDGSGDVALDRKIATGNATISLRLTGISPAATLGGTRSSYKSILDVIVACALASAIIGIQVAGYLYNRNQGSSRQALLMGLIGYIGIVVWSTGLLLLLGQEVVLESDPIHELSINSQWTISNSTHSRWTIIGGLQSKALVAAAPAKHSPESARSMEF